MAELPRNKPDLLAALRSGAWVPLLGGFLIHLTLGTVYCWASNTLYVTSALRDEHQTISYSITFPTYATALVVQVA